MLNHFKLASLSLGLLLLGACDHDDDTTPRGGKLQDPISCGGFAGLECPESLTCVDDPKDDCDPAQGGADCLGVCEAAVTQPGHGPKPRDPIACGGFAGLECPHNLSCVDDPNDDCDPAQGGADCIGVCEHAHGPKPHKQKCGDADRSYVSHDPDQCAAIRFKCADGEVAFFDECGCGCEPA